MGRSAAETQNFIKKFLRFNKSIVLLQSRNIGSQLLRYGVMVALQILALSVRVRVLLSQQILFVILYIFSGAVPCGGFFVPRFAEYSFAEYSLPTPCRYATSPTPYLVLGLFHFCRPALPTVQTVDRQWRFTPLFAANGPFSGPLVTLPSPHGPPASTRRSSHVPLTGNLFSVHF